MFLDFFHRREADLIESFLNRLVIRLVFYRVFLLVGGQPRLRRRMEGNVNRRLEFGLGTVVFSVRSELFEK